MAKDYGKVFFEKLEGFYNKLSKNGTNITSNEYGDVTLHPSWLYTETFERNVFLQAISSIFNDQGLICTPENINKITISKEKNGEIGLRIYNEKNKYIKITKEKKYADNYSYNDLVIKINSILDSSRKSKKTTEKGVKVGLEEILENLVDYYNYFIEEYKLNSQGEPVERRNDQGNVRKIRHYGNASKEVITRKFSGEERNRIYGDKEKYFQVISTKSKNNKEFDYITYVHRKQDELSDGYLFIIEPTQNKGIPSTTRLFYIPADKIRDILDSDTNKTKNIYDVLKELNKKYIAMSHEEFNNSLNTMVMDHTENLDEYKNRLEFYMLGNVPKGSEVRRHFSDHYAKKYRKLFGTVDKETEESYVREVEEYMEMLKYLKRKNKFR